MMLKVLSKRERNIFYATLGVVIFAALFNFAFAPFLYRNDALNKEIDASRKKLEKYAWLLSQKDIIQKKYGKLNMGQEVSGSKEDTLVSALSELEDLAKKANIKIVDLRPQASKASGLYKEILIDLRTEGTIEGYLSFMYNLESSLYLLKISKFQLSSRPSAQTLEGIFSITQISASD